ncbi:hypothetical protein FZI91_14910 [Mycobacterium sp. CBMA271]|uniref:hypothetical protein n=1 Tax=unclassified Mycobacteroides TaxID=2618759 RepID=UPI0012DBEA97|nr:MULTISPECIES: hypothetical protein [unclassified Mycobacteroides]MUM22987.1 hypothetical protein [Mycobacteroides sp. CBMA 271]
MRNTVGAVLAASAVAASSWVDVLERGRIHEYVETRYLVHTVTRGQSTLIDGQEWKLGSIRELGKAPTARHPAPKGTEITVVQIVRTGTPTNPDLCTAYLVQGDRRWKAETAYGGDYWVKPPDDGTSQDCNKPGSLQFSFLVPVDADPSSIEIMGSDNAVRVRLKL